MKKITVLIAVLFAFSLLFTKQSHAQETPIQQSSYPLPTSAPSQHQPQSLQEFAPRLSPDVDSDLRSLTQGLMIEIVSGLICQLSGIDPLDVSGRCLGIDPQTRTIGYTEPHGGGAIGFVSRAASSTFNIPVSSHDYTTYLASSFGVAPKAYAQGNGFQGLSPVLEVWRVFRNLVYVFFVLIFMLVGLGIMFRVKLDPRTVMTIQNSIPRLIVALILVTFSYAIAGFLIDIMFVLIYLSFNLAAQVYASAGIGAVNPPNIFQTPFGYADDIFALDVPLLGKELGIMSIVTGSSWAVSGLIVGLFDGFIDTTIGSLLSFALNPIFAPLQIACSVIDKVPHLSQVPGLGIIDKIPLVGSLPLIGGGGPECSLDGGKIAEILVFSISGLIAFLVILVAVLWSLFKLWFALIKAFIFLLLDVVFAPFWIALGVLPGGMLGFNAWLRDVISNLIVFPAVTVMFLLGKIFMDAFGNYGGGSEDVRFIPPLIGNPGDVDTIGPIIGLAFILITPSIVDNVKKMLKTPQPDLRAAQQAIGAGRATVSAGGGYAWGRLTQKSDLSRGQTAGPLRKWAAGPAPEDSASRIQKWRHSFFNK